MKDLRHFLIVAVLVAVGTFGLGSVLTVENLLPQAASRQAVPIDWLFGLHFWMIAFLFSLIIGFMIYSVIVFRRKPGDMEDAEHVEGNTPLEIMWTVVPLGVVIYFSFLGAQALAGTQRVDPTAIEVDVIGQQWSWRFEYPDLGITSSELVLPVNKQALLDLQSNDVLHSFWVPEFRVKQDLLPGGEVRELRISPTELGDYKVRCAEICGREHSSMLADVRVISQTEFDAWVIEMQGFIPEDPIARGELWYTQYGCLACHTLDGTVRVGPSWVGIWGDDRVFDDGTTGVVDEAYLIESMREPAAKIVEGYPNAMPANAAADMTDEQLQDVIEFIKSLDQ